MKLIDSHAHIYLDAFRDDRPSIIARAREAGIERICMPNIDLDTVADMLSLTEQFPGYCLPMMGIHPCSVDGSTLGKISTVEKWLGEEKFCAVGEIGTDLYWDRTFFKEQCDVFRVQCELALQHDLPVVIHCRDSIDETIALVKEFKSRGLKGVFHCFTGSMEQAREIIDLGFYLGIGGVVTFKNGGLEPVVRQVDLKSILLETDSPYLAPVPFRGKRNEPSYISEVAKKIALIRDEDVQKIGDITAENCCRLFALDEL